MDGALMDAREIYTQVHNDIEKAMPHRYENKLIDCIFTHPNDIDYPESMSAISIRRGDSLNRDCFLVASPDQQAEMIPVSIGLEISALFLLASNFFTQTTPELHEESFLTLLTGFTDVQSYEPLYADDMITGFPDRKYRKKVIRPGEIVSSRGISVYQGVGRVLSVGIQCCYLRHDLYKEKKQSTEKGFDKKLVNNINEGLYAKAKSMIFVSHLERYSDEECIAYYHYDENHPFIRGHFPDAPIMMGVLQLQAAIDTLQSYLNLHDFKQSFSFVTFNATLSISEHTVTAVMTGATVSVKPNPLASNKMVELKSLKKVKYVHPVTYPSTLKIHLSLTSLDEEME